MVLQLGISLIMPVLICIAFCYWLTESFGFDSFIYIPGILFGLISGGMTAYKFYLAVMKRNGKGSKKKDKKDPVSFNEHI